MFVSGPRCVLWKRLWEGGMRAGSSKWICLWIKVKSVRRWRRVAADWKWQLWEILDRGGDSIASVLVVDFMTS